MKPLTKSKWDHLLLEKCCWYSKQHSWTQEIIPSDKIVAAQMRCFPLFRPKLCRNSWLLSYWHPFIRSRYCHSVSCQLWTITCSTIKSRKYLQMLLKCLHYFPYSKNYLNKSCLCDYRLSFKPTFYNLPSIHHCLVYSSLQSVNVMGSLYLETIVCWEFIEPRVESSLHSESAQFLPRPHPTHSSGDSTQPSPESFPWPVLSAN